MTEEQVATKNVPEKEVEEKVEDKSTVPAPPVQSSPPASAAPLEAKYPIQRLIAEGLQILGAEPRDVAGALHGRAMDEELTPSSVRELVDQWLTQTH